MLVEHRDSDYLFTMRSRGKTTAHSSKRDARAWSGRILKPAIKPKSTTLSAIRKAVRDERREKSRRGK
jgi:hypothetical protein